MNEVREVRVEDEGWSTPCLQIPQDDRSLRLPVPSSTPLALRRKTIQLVPVPLTTDDSHPIRLKV